MPNGITNEPYLIGSDVVSRVFISAQKKYIKTKLAKSNWASLKLLQLLESIKEKTGVSGDDGAINDGLQLVPQLLGQFYRGEDTINTPQLINDSLRFETIYTNHILPIKLSHDEWRQRGWEITPHGDGDFASRVKAAGESRLQRLSDDLLQYTLDGVNQRFGELLELAYWKQGASYKEPVGINGQFPITPMGMIMGHNRTTVPAMRHLVQSSTIGAGGTTMADLRRVFRQLNENTVNSDLSGEWVLMAGGGWMDGYGSEIERVGVVRNGEVGGVTKADMVVLDDAMRVGTLKPIWCPMLDKMDTVAASEKGLPVSTTNIVTFSGGGATSQAIGVAMVTAGGAVQAVIITDPGVGYTSAPTIAISGITGLTSGTNIIPKVYSASGGAGLVQVAADDYRIGQLAGVFGASGVLLDQTTAVGTTGTPGVQVNFTNRAYLLFKPAMRYLIGNGVDRRIVIPADPARSRYTELQMETLSYFYNRLPSAFAMLYRSN